MKKIFLLLLLFIGLQKAVEAAHLKGGWIQYEYLGHIDSINASKYKITIYQYLLCSSGNGQIDAQVHLGIFDASNDKMYTEVTVDSVKNGSVLLNKTTYDPCIHNKPSVCYLINKYITTINLPDNDAGYVLAVQRCCRIAGIINVPNSGEVGITYSNKIPGVINGVSYRANSSPAFVQKDTALICYSAPFTIDFHAVDSDANDSLSYSFCEGLEGGYYSLNNAGSQPDPPSNPPYTPIPYVSPLYGGGFPLGTNVTIDPVTGIISGTAPAVVGDYVIAVCVSEFRQGVLMAISRKEIHITVADCSLSAAALKPAYINCNDLTFTFFNESTSPDIISYQWIFGDSSSHSNDTALIPMPVHVYGDTGIYHLNLTVMSQGGCVDSAKAMVRVYPGFKANFTVKSSCIINPYNFFDSTYSKYGKVDSLHWNFGVPNITSDTSSLKDPSYKYSTPGTKNVSLFVRDNNGCTDSITKTIIVRANPDLYLPFKDTLICNVDTLQLSAIINNPVGTPVYSWSPSDSMINPDSPTPFVHPKNTDNTFYIKATDEGCVASDSVHVYTLANITVTANPDTSICKTDTIRLFADTHTDKRGIKLKWISNAEETIEPIQRPLVKPLVNPTNYYVFANLGNKCFAKDTTMVNVYPYPFANAGANDSVCYNGNITVHASIVGDVFNWSPTSTLSNSSSLSPTITPDSTTSYILTAYYQNNTCPKPYKDTITIAVIPQVVISAVIDTFVVYNQPLKLIVSGNVDTATTHYEWTNMYGGNLYLDKSDIFNPTGIYPLYVDSVKYQVKATINNPKHCYALDTIKVVVFKTPPEIFVPSAFTPNGDQVNDIIRPFPVGVLKLDYFSIYNRMGQLLYTTSQIGQGWDGTYQGVNQPPGTYVYTVQGTNYLGTTVRNKGTVVLIR